MILGWDEEDYVVDRKPRASGDDPLIEVDLQGALG